MSESKAKQYAEGFYPGLVALVESLGEGDYLELSNAVSPRGGGIGRVETVLHYKVAADNTVVDVRYELKLTKGRAPWVPFGPPVNLIDWTRTYARMHYGSFHAQPGVAKEEETFFRINISPTKGRNIHVEPDIKFHTPFQDVSPNPDMDPRDFVELVKKYRKDQIYPFRLRSK